MFFAGIDLGSRSSKIAIFEDDQLTSTYVGETGLGSARTAEMIMDQALRETGLKLNDFEVIVSTGYGRVVVPFAHKNISDILSHAKGSHWYFPSCRTILDLGGQDSKAINIDEKGKLTGFTMNDKCASGNGRFLEVMAHIVEIPLEKLGEYSLGAEETIKFSSICAIFCKSEALSMLRKGRDKRDILAGIHNIIRVQCRKMLELISIEKDLVMSGGVSKNIGVVERVKEELGMQPLLAPDPQLTGAVGAAVVAREIFLSKK
jgi:predicted CoA-substrate-specific enzyme activase